MKSKMEARVEAVEHAMSLLQESVQKNRDEFKEWIAEARADREKAKAERERLSGQIAELLRQGMTSPQRETGRREKGRGQRMACDDSSATSRSERALDGPGDDIGGEHRRWRQREPLLEESNRGETEEIEINAGCGGHGHSNNAFNGCTSESKFEEELQKAVKDEQQPPLTCVLAIGAVAMVEQRCLSTVKGKEKEERNGGHDKSGGGDGGRREEAGVGSPKEGEGQATTKVSDETVAAVAAIATVQAEKVADGVSSAAATAAMAAQAEKAAMAQGEIAAAARRTSRGGCVMRKENEAGAEMDGSTWGSMSTQMDKAHIRAVRKGGLPQWGPIFIILGQAHITKKQKLSCKGSYYFSELIGQAHFNPKHVNTYFLLSLGLDKFVESPIKQWDPGGIYL